MAIIRYHSVQLEEKCNCKQSIKSELQGMLKHTSTVELHEYGSNALCGTFCLPYRPTSLPLLPADATARLIQLFFFCTMAQQPLVGQGVLIDKDSRSYSEGLLWTSDHRDAETSDNTTHNTQQTNIHASGGTRTHNPTKRAAVDPRLRPHGGWVRHPTF